MAAKRKRSIIRTIARGVLVVATLGFVYISYIYLTLPDVRSLATNNPRTTAFMELRIDEARADGRKLSIRHQWVPYARISPFLKRAVIVTEDAAFFDHDGIDLEEIKASLEKNWEEGQFLRGASTITQQLAKNLYLSPSRNPMRKVTELLITRRLEAALTKQRILEIYLNMIEWGDGIFGCEAAARAYYGKSCAGLDVPEAAMLAGAIINPREHNPAKPTRRLLRRQQIILRRMQFKPPAPAETVAPVEPVTPAPMNESAPIENPLIPVPQPFPIPPSSNRSINGSPPPNSPSLRPPSR
ncbi:MAG TPA: monofunctional biosynthetic peptidoglycan transglycosylase [Vicinamibacterales bacterium]|nr:monofunctional biosynthetic peptidoglycan transglycosylase [Vicinamibacterales bacterium]